MSFDDLLTLDEVAELIGVTLDELRQLHSERLMDLFVRSVAGYGPRFRRADVEKLPAHFEPVEEWSPEKDQHGNSSEFVEA